MKKCTLRQKKARCKRILSQANEDDNIGLKGGTCENHVNINKLHQSFYYSDLCGEKKSLAHLKHKLIKIFTMHEDLVNKANRDATIETNKILKVYDFIIDHFTSLIVN